MYIVVVGRIYYLYINILKRVISDPKLCSIIKTIAIFTTIPKHANVLAQVNKSPYGHLHHTTPHDAYTITIHVYTVTLAAISHKQKE